MGTSILTFLWALFSSSSTIIYGIITAAGAAAAIWFTAKKTGAREEAQRAHIDQLKRSYEAVNARKDIDDGVRDMSDEQLERLRLQYDTADVSDHVRGVEPDKEH